jgi:excinuclease ABC subunit A
MIHGAREHNLKNISLNIPKRTLTVITGVSGSGKSSLAFDTIYAEGQRRYVESLSAYARQFLDMSHKPDVDRIDGLAPAIAIDQKTTSKNPRSTVGTITEIYDYLRLLYANAGTPYCPNHPDVEIHGFTIQQMVDQVLAWPEGAKIMVMAPVVRGRKGEYKKEMQLWQSQGYTRAEINGEVHELASAPKLNKNDKHDIALVIDRLVVKENIRTRLADALATALKLGEGLALVAEISDSPIPAKAGIQKSAPRRQTFSEKHSCPICGHATQLEPRLFSFNSPFGACQACDGLGEVLFFDPALIVPDENLTLRQGALHPWKDPKAGMNKTSTYYLKPLAVHYNFSLDTPWKKLPETIRSMLLNGNNGERVEFVFENASGRSSFKTRKPYDGLIPILTRRWEESSNPYAREDLNRYRSTKPCETCHGARLNPSALNVTLPPKSTSVMPAKAGIHDKSRAQGALNISAYCSLPITAALLHTSWLQKNLKGNTAAIATPILREIFARLGFLNHVGLGYLSLDRMAGTLSGGEAQRIRLASQIGSGLTGVLYVLDEPSIGLHQRDNGRLLETLERLRDLDNTVLVVEHDEDAIRHADFVVDIGPRAGIHGGQVLGTGSVKDIMANKNSLTADYLSGRKKILVPKNRRPIEGFMPAKAGIHTYSSGKWLTVEGARGNNLKNVTVQFPVGVMTCVTGVSGSGKSTLVMDTLHTAIAALLNGSREHPAPYGKLTGLEHIDKLVNIDQSPIGRTPRSNPATYTGVYGPIRDWYCNLPQSKARGYGPGRFSFNVKGGRCEACEGDGVIRVDMQFLPDVYVPCEVCNGKRFNRETLEITYNGATIADVLAMTVDTACDFFKNIPPVYKKLETLREVGLGYIALGQPATQLSGGEAQRIKLATELSKRATGRTLYILDEPTTGLHFADIDQLLKVLHKLVDGGNTMIIIEHNLDIIKTADWIIDIGPEGGAAGGTVVAQGTPEQVAKHKTSVTAPFLKAALQG